MTPEELEKQIRAEEEAQRVSEGLPAAAAHLKGGKSVAHAGEEEATSNRSVSPSPAASADNTLQGYDNIIGYLQKARESMKVENAEQRKLRERKERSQSIVNGISDLGRAIANMYYTTQGAPNGYDDKQSLSAKHRAKLEKQRKEREADNDKYVTYLLKEKQLLDADRAAGLAALKQRLAERQQEAAIANDKALLKLRQDQLAHDKAELAAKEDYWDRQLGIRQQDADTRTTNANTNKTKARNAAAGGSKEDNGHTTTTTIHHDEYGNETGKTVVKRPNKPGEKEKYPFKSK